MSIFRSSKIQK